MVKLLADLPPLLRRGAVTSAVLDLADMYDARFDPAPGRTFATGTDLAPPERVPFSDDDFDSELQRRDICRATRVTDEEGRALQEWRRPEQPFGPDRAYRVAIAA
jgi:hypothetical protein